MFLWSHFWVTSYSLCAQGACMSTGTCMWVPAEASREHQIPWSRVESGCDPPSLGPLEKQQVFLTAEVVFRPLSLALNLALRDFSSGKIVTVGHSTM